MSDIKAIPGFWNGISQQAPAMRKENQAERQVNAYGTLVNGLEKRRGTNHLAVLETVSAAEAFANAQSWTLDLGADGTFIVIAVDDADDPVQVFDLDGVKQTVNYQHIAIGAGWDANEYFAGTQAINRRIKAVTIGSRMVFANTETVCTVTDTAPTITLVPVQAFDPGGDTIYSAAHPLSNGDRVQYQQLTSIGISPLVNNGMYYVVSKLTDTFQVSLTPGGAAIDITGTNAPSGQFRKASALINGEVQTFADLPDKDDSPPIAVNDVYKIQGDDTSKAKYYVKWNGSVWEETYNPEESSDVFTNVTMPVELVYDSDDEEFLVNTQTWLGRTAGDSETNPTPSCVGQTINNVFFTRGRFGMLSGNNVLMSRVGAEGYTQFYPTSVIDVLDDDPIDIAVSADNLDILRSVSTMEKAIIAFADRTQFSIHSGESSVLSVNTVTVDPTTRFEIEPHHQPFAAGSNILFLCQTPQFLTMREYFVQEDSLQADAADITIHVPRLLPAGDGQVIGLNVLDVAFVRVSTDPTKLFVYKYYWVGDEKLQSSWSIWEFDGNIISITSFEKSLYLLVERDGVITLESMDIEGDIDSTLGIHIHLDRKVALADGVDVTYAAEGDRTTFVLPYEPVDPDLLIIICPATGAVLHPDDFTQDESNPEQFYLTGDYTGEDWVAGVGFEMEYELSQFFLRNENGIAIQGGRIAIRRLWLEYRETGYFEIEVAAQGRETRAAMAVGISGNMDVITDYDTINVVDGADKFPVFLNSKDAKVTVSNDTFMPCQIVAGSWEYLFTPRVRPVG